MKFDLFGKIMNKKRSLRKKWIFLKEWNDDVIEVIEIYNSSFVWLNRTIQVFYGRNVFVQSITIDAIVFEDFKNSNSKTKMIN